LIPNITAAELGADASAITTDVDDAYFLTGRKTALAEIEARIEDRRRQPLVGLSLHHRGTSELDAKPMSSGLAGALDSLSERTGAGFLFLSHMHSVTAKPHHRDLRFGEEVRQRMRHGDRVLLVDSPLLDREVKHLSAACDFFVSTRYHGAVFALSGGVPTLALTQDEHTRVKMHGLLDVLGLEAPVLDAGSSELGRLLLDSWERRRQLRDVIRAANDRAHTAVEHTRGQLADFYESAR
jgi:polysaccharide pyruvyl transferase WcaK-like protein